MTLAVAEEEKKNKEEEEGEQEEEEEEEEEEGEEGDAGNSSFLGNQATQSDQNEREPPVWPSYTVCGPTAPKVPWECAGAADSMSNYECWALPNFSDSC